MKKHLKSVITLTAICAVVSLLMAITNSITAPIIEKRKNEASFEALLQVLPDGEDFKEVDLSEFDLPDTITKGYSEKNGGYVFEIVTKGYSTDMTIMCGINADGAVTGATYLSGGETHAIKETYGDWFKGKTIEDVDSVDTKSGSTLTTSAYKAAVKDALGAKTIIGGGSVDLRSEEEIFNDNLSAALPDGGDKFTLQLLTVEIPENYTVYKADSGKGLVFVKDEVFIGVDSTGKVVSDIADSEKATVEAHAKFILNDKLTEIDITALKDKLPDNIDKAFKSSNGNYVLNIHANGYGITGDRYVRSNQPILIDVSVTKEGKIISCVTVSQKESEGIGDACGKPSFYSQFNGKNASDYTGVDAISGATVTTNAYMNAIKNVFEAIKILEGGK